MTNIGIWKPMMAPVRFMKFFIAWTLSLFTNSFCHTISSLSKIPSRYSTNLFTRFHDITSLWPGHKLARLDVISPSGPVISVRHADGQIPLLDTYFSTYRLCIPELHLYDHPVTVWRLIQSRHPPMIVIGLLSHGLRIRLLYVSIKLSQCWCFVTDLIALTYFGWMSITSFPNDTTPLSIDINVHDQETLIIGWPMD